MPDIATLRSEIKTWERNFKADNGRNPSIDDIKQLPQIAEKYKLYKKLSKSGGSQSADSSLSSSLVPHRDGTSSSSLAVQRRHVEATAPLATFNPFSPQKSKKKSEAMNFGRLNPSPFSTPTKAKSALRARWLVQDDDDQLSAAPMIQPAFTPKVSDVSSFAPDSAVRRARKRLRGEPVSPSPSKPKRRRVAPIQSLLSFPRHPKSTPHSEEEDVESDNTLAVEGTNDDISFAETPMKSSAGSKSYKFLFEEVPFPPQLLPAQASSIPEGRLQSDDVHPLKEQPDRAKITQTKDRVSRRTGNKRRYPESEPEPEGLNLEAEKISDPEAPLSTNSTKFLPPSPPPIDPYGTRPGRRKGVNGAKPSASSNRVSAKGPAARSSKKPKLAQSCTNELDDESDIDTDDWALRVQIVDRLASVKHRLLGDKHPDTEPLDAEEPMLLSYRDGEDSLTLAYGSSVADGDSSPPEVIFPLEAQKFASAGSTMLPARMATLSVSPSKAKDDEVHVLEHLLYRRPRKGRLYDSRRGGEIWGAGEAEEEDKGTDNDELLAGGAAASGVKKLRGAETEDDEDWEGEPVPWEIGEL